MSNLIEVQCSQCGEPVLRKPADINRTKIRFCSRVCSGLYQTKVITLSCKECKKSFQRSMSDLRRVKNCFCSMSCAGRFNMRGKPSHNRGEHFVPKPRRSLAEYWTDKHGNQLDTWKGGVFQPSEKVCKSLLIFERGNGCEICGWAEVNPHTGRIPVELEHKDGDCYNNRYENLSLLCPNHQSLTSTYRGANARKGRGRKMYKVVSQWAKEKGIGITTGV